MKSIRFSSLTAAFLATFLPCAWAQIGPEFQVNTQTIGRQYSPALVLDGAGNFVVAWESGPNFYADIIAQRFDSGGNTVGGEFQVNSYTTDDQARVAIVTDPAGNFTLVWHSDGQDGADLGIYGRRYDSAGNAVGGEFQVNTYTTNRQSLPAIAADGAGGFVVVWESFLQLSGVGALTEIFGRRYDSGGSAVGGEFQVNTYTTNNQGSPAIAFDGAGNFVVVWTSLGDESGLGIFGQRYDGSASPVGGEFQVNTYTTGNQAGPKVAADGTGNFMVAWGRTPGAGVFGQRYDSGGNPVGGEFEVSTYTPLSFQAGGEVVADGAGNFTVVWTGEAELDGLEVLGRRYDSAGSAIGPKFQVNDYTAGDQGGPAIATDAAGNFVVVWPSADQDGDSSGIFGQRYDAAGRQTVLGRLAKIVNPSTGVRTVELRGRESPSNSTVIGDPLTYGATVEVIAHGDADQDQMFSLPPGAAAPGVPGWTPAGSGDGWKYIDRSGVNGPVRRVTVRKLRRAFLVTVAIKGTASSPSPGVGLTPPGNGTDAGLIFTILGPYGATYCVNLGGPHGGTISNTATAFFVRRATAVTGCLSP
jgi:hypothetical protein